MHVVLDKVQVDLLEHINKFDLVSLCEVAEYTMIDTPGFSVGAKRWMPPMQQHLAEYFKGVLLVENRKLIVSRIASQIVGSLQLLLPCTDKFSNFAVSIRDLFVAKAYRHFGAANAMITFTENYVKMAGYQVINMTIRSDMVDAIALVEKLGYKKWGVQDKYESVGNNILSGYFYSKDI